MKYRKQVAFTWPMPYRWWGEWRTPYYVFCNFRWWVRDFKELWQRAFYGYSRGDLWSWFDYMAKVNAMALQELRMNRMGSPVVKCRHWVGGWPPSNGCECVHKVWDKKLDLMIDGFMAVIEEDDLPPKCSLMLDKGRNRRIKKGLRCYAENFLGLWD